MKSIMLTRTASVLVSFCLLFQMQLALAETVKLSPNTRVYIETRESLVAKGDQVTQGQTVRSSVWRDVTVGGNVLIAAGTPVLAKVDEVKKRKVAGKKGELSIVALETESVDGQVVQLSGGYHKEGKSRMALSISLAVIVFLPLIFIPGKAAELPAGTVFDAYIDQTMDINIGNAAPSKTVNLSHLSYDISAELLYDRLTETEKPKYFEFDITVPRNAAKKFVIDHINSKPVTPLDLDITSERGEDDETVATAQIKIKTLVKEFVKGINTIEIANVAGGDRVSTSLIIDIEI